MNNHKKYITENIEYLKDAGIRFDEVITRDSFSLKRTYCINYNSVWELCQQMLTMLDKGVFKDEITRVVNKPLGSKFNEVTKSTYKDLRHFATEISEGRVPEFLIDTFHAVREDMLDTDKIRSLIYSAETKKRRRVFEEQGSELEIDRLLSGDEHHWSRMKGGAKKTVCKLGFNNTDVKGETEEQQMAKSINTLIVADCLSKAGVSTEIYSNMYWSPVFCISDFEFCLSIKLKSADEHLDWQRVLSSAMSPLYTRIINCLCYYLVYNCQGNPIYKQVRNDKGYWIDTDEITGYNHHDYKNLDNTTTTGYVKYYNEKWEQYQNYDIFLDRNEGESGTSNKIEQFLNKQTTAAV